MNNWIDRKSLFTGVLTGIVLFLLYKHFTKTVTNPTTGEQKTTIVSPGA